MTVRLYKGSWKSIDQIQIYDALNWNIVDALWRYTDLYGWRQVYPNVTEPNVTITTIETTETTATIGWVVEQSVSVLVEVYLQSNLSTPVFSILRDGTSPNSYTVTGLIVNTAYQAKLTATSSSGVQVTDVRNFTTTNQTPGAPTNLVASTGRVDGINLTWLAPSNVGGGPITEYQIQRNQDPVAILSQTNWTSVGLVTSYLAEQVDPSPTTYYFRVRAVNSFGAGAPSAVSNAGSKVAATDVDLAANRTTINRNDFTALVARIKNNGVNVNVANIPITFSILSGPGSFSSSSSVTTTTINTNANGQSSVNYHSSSTTGTAWIVANTNGLTGSSVFISVVGTAPSAPTNLSGSSNSTGTAITFSWSAPTDNGGDPVNSYEFQRNQNPTPGTEWVNVGTATSWTTSGLNPGTTYYIRVRAINDFGTSAYAEIIVTTATVPGAPTNFTGSSNASGTTISLSWQAPISNGGSAITGYQFQRNQSSTPGDTWLSLGLVTSWDSNNTNPGTTYYFRVRAVNDVGVGSTSTIIVTALSPTTTAAPTTAAPTPGPTTAPPTTAPPTPKPPAAPPPLPPPPPPPAPPPPTVVGPTPSPPVKATSLGPDTRVLTRDFGFIEVKYLSVGDILVSMNIEEVPTFGNDFDVDNWSSDTFTNLGTTETSVTNIFARQIVGTLVRINGEWFTDNHNILVEKDGVYYFKQSIDIDTTYKVFDYDIMDWAPVIDVYHQPDSESIVYVVDCEPYDVFFTENALVYNRKEYFN